ncbi:hypothetical protein SLA2020_248510 [Shorea laevis]
MLCAATGQSIKIWDLESKSIVEDLKVDLKAEAEKSEGDGASNKKKVIMNANSGFLYFWAEKPRVILNTWLDLVKAFTVLEFCYSSETGA